ncbi:hypothetical protein PENSPDRAFT_476286 [Peniophora sp. CONT]|nr:hypothetical protein PENSPDRAFT_476286 [Peniophora sp. CONT]
MLSYGYLRSASESFTIARSGEGFRTWIYRSRSWLGLPELTWALGLCYLHTVCLCLDAVGRGLASVALVLISDYAVTSARSQVGLRGGLSARSVEFGTNAHERP